MKCSTGLFFISAMAFAGLSPADMQRTKVLLYVGVIGFFAAFAVWLVDAVIALVVCMVQRTYAFTRYLRVVKRYS